MKPTPLSRPIATALLALVLILPVLAAAPTKDESSAFNLARRALGDGLFDTAEQRLSGFITKFPASVFKAEALLLRAQALYYLGRYDAALGPLDGAVKGGSNVALFWQGETLNALQRWGPAEASYRAFLEKEPKDANGPAAQLGLAWSLLRQEKEKEARELLTKLTAGGSAKSDAGQSASLLLAKNLITKKHYKEASDELNKLVALLPKSKIFFEASYLLGEIAYVTNRAGDAVEPYLKVTTNPKAFPKPLVAQAWFGLGRAYSAINEPDKAMGAFEQAYTLGEAEQLKMAAFKHYLQNARALKRLPEATAKLQEFSKKNPDNPNAAAALFAIGQSLAENKENDKAAGVLESLLVAYPKSVWRAPTQFLLGTINRQAGKLEAAISSFNQAIEASENSELTRKAQIEAGRAAYDQKDFAKAIGYFDKAQSQKDELGEQAGYNALLAIAQLDKVDDLQKAIDKFTAAYPRSDCLTGLPLLQGRQLERLGQVEAARAVYEKAIATAPGEERAQLTLRLGDLLALAGKHDEAWQVYDQFAATFPNDPALPQVARKGIIAGLTAQKIPEDQATQALQALLAKFPKDPDAAETLFHLGELSWNRQDFVNAQSRFEQVAKDYPKSPLYDDALWWAGKAAAAHNALADAIAILEKVPDGSPLKPDARQLQGRIFHQQLKFDNALKLYDAVLDTEKSGPNFVKATLRKGDTLFALGEKDYSKYEQAAAAYGIILNGNQGNFLERNEAAYRRGKCLEMLKRRDDAMALYMDVLNGRLLVTPEGQPATPPPEFIWQIKAGLDAARIREEAKDWRGAIAVYRKLEQLGGPNQQEFRDNINRIRRDNYLYD